MGMGMSTRLYPLSGGDGNEIKIWYLLDLGIWMKMNFFYGNGYGIAKSVPSNSLIPFNSIIYSKEFYISFINNKIF